MNIIKELEKRKLIKQISNRKKLIKIFYKKKNNIYCGFDPTSDSLHLGHLIPLITLKRLIKIGHKINILLGETTSIIGDPSFRTKKRLFFSKKKINLFTQKIKKQIENILKNNNKITFLNNKNWFNKMKITFLLKNIGEYFIINQMLNKKAIKKINLETKQKLSFSELSYNILQSYDFLYLYENKNINIQIGGSDQWGNITSGIKLIKKIHNKEVFGITLPLITKKNGLKYSKSEKKNLWLDSKKTNPYEFYQFWLNISDNLVNLFLKQLTFLKLKQIKRIKKFKNINISKQILAKKITTIIHGEKNIKKIKSISKILFLNFKKKITEKDLKKLYNNKLFINKLEIKNNIYIKDILILLNITKSKTQSFNLIKNKSIQINKNKIINTNYKLTKKDKLFNKFTILNKGKKNIFLIIWKQ